MEQLEQQLNSLDGGSLRNVFVNQLSLLYAAKSHLAESLPALVEHAAFQTLKNALKEDFEDNRKQMIYLQEIFVLLNESTANEYCLGMKAITKEAHDHILFHDGKNYESDMSIIFYMGVIEHLQIGAGRMLNLIALNTDYLPYAQLVEETLDMSKDNANLFHLIAGEYIKKK
jgi:ferritin-like metal-binding protein YciE